MAGATSDAIDPVEAVEDDIGRSRKLIAATLDDLTQHHSWLETYHREERLRAERLRRQETLERLEAKRQRTAKRVRRLTVTTCAKSRTVAAFVARHALAFARWAEPRAREAARRARTETARAWSWTRQKTPGMVRQGFEATRAGFFWSVRASEETGIAVRRRASEFYSRLAIEAAQRSAPARRRAAIGWIRARRDAWRQRTAFEIQLTEAVQNSEGIAACRKTAYRGTVRCIRAWRHGALLAQRNAILFEGHVTESILQATPKFQRLLRSHMPEGMGSPGSGQALIVRPSTALVCPGKARSLLPALIPA